MVSSDQWQVIFVCFLIDVLNELDNGVWGGPVTNATGEEHIPQALSNIVLVFAMSRALPGIFKEIMEGNECGFVFSRHILEIVNETDQFIDVEGLHFFLFSGIKCSSSVTAVVK